MTLQEQKEKQKKYWQDRQEKQFLAGEKQGYKLAFNKNISYHNNTF